MRARLIPALAVLAGLIGDPAVRHKGTLGGSVANNDPAADYPAAVLALDATVKTTRRSIAADAFFTGLFQTALADGELITEIAFPIPLRAGYAKFPNPASRYALVGVFVAQFPDAVRVAVTGAAPCVFRVPEMEKALERELHAGHRRRRCDRTRRSQFGPVRVRGIPRASRHHHGQTRSRRRARVIAHDGKRKRRAAIVRP